MTTMIVLVIILFAVSILIPIVWVARAAYDAYHAERTVFCPVDGEGGLIQLDARRAARTAVFGGVDLKVKACTLWPARIGCKEECLREVELT